MLLGSVKKLQVEDLLVIVAMITDAILMVGMSIISQTSSNLIDPSEHVVLDAAEIDKREYGSKWVLVVEQMQILTIWLMKYCLLLMYNRLTMSLSQNLAVKFVAAYVTVGFVVMEILYLGVWCRPFNQYWAVPPENSMFTLNTLRLYSANLLSSMLRCYKPSHHQRRPQHHLRRHDHPHPHANFPQIPAPIETQGRPHWCLCPRRLHNPLRHPQQILLLQRTIRLKLDILVHPRILHRHHHRQPSLHLDPSPPYLQARFFQRLNLRKEYQ
jgi:hypothetical protein